MIALLKQSPKARIVFGVAALLIVTVAAWAVFRSGPPKETAYQPVPVAEVRITAQGFEPSVISVKKGTKITWVNDDDKMHQVVSNPHPSHEGLSGLKSEILNNEQTYEYTAGQTGSYGYHDEINPIINGTIEVQE